MTQLTGFLSKRTKILMKLKNVMDTLKSDWYGGMQVDTGHVSPHADCQVYPTVQMYFGEEDIERLTMGGKFTVDLPIHYQVYVSTAGDWLKDIDALIARIQDYNEQYRLREYYDLDFVEDQFIHSIKIGFTADDIRGQAGMANLTMLVRYRFESQDMHV